MILDVAAGMFMVELQFYTRHADTVFTAARAVSKKSITKQQQSWQQCCSYFIVYSLLFVSEFAKVF